MKKNAFVAILVSVFAVLATSCSDVMSGENLETLAVKAEQPIVEVENFDEIEAIPAGNSVYNTNDGNVIKTEVVGLTSRGVSFDTSNETSDSRVVNVVFHAENNDGVQRTARTSYVQKKKSSAVQPVEPIIVDYRLEADTTMLYREHAAYMNLVVRRISIFNDGSETSEEIYAMRGSLAVCAYNADENGSKYITDNADVNLCTSWGGIDRNFVEEKTSVEKEKCTVRAKVDEVICKPIAKSDAGFPQELITSTTCEERTITFTDEVSGKSLEYVFKINIEHVGYHVEDRGLENLNDVNGVFRYRGTRIDELNISVNGYVYSHKNIRTHVYHGKVTE